MLEPAAPNFVDWQESARKVSARFRECARKGRSVDLDNLKAALLVLGKVKSIYGLFDSNMRDWCIQTQMLFEEAVDGKQIDFNHEEAAYCFDLISDYFA